MSSPSSASPRADQFARALLLTALYSSVALVCMHLTTASDPDIWWHLRAGEWILQHHSLPHVDPFSRSAAQQPWAAYSWLFEVLVLKLYRNLDLTGLVAYSSALTLAITAAIHHATNRLQADFTKVMLLTFAAAISISRLYAPRPWLFTILFFVIEIDVLMYARRTGKTRELLFLPVLFALWSNLHIQFVDGLLVLALAVAEAFLSEGWWQRARLPRATMCWAGIACLLATMANPYGWKIYQVAYALASQPGVLNTVSELQAMPFRSLSDFLVLGLILAAVASLAGRKRIPIFEALLLALAVFLSFRSQRDLWFGSLVAVVILASETSGAEEQRQHCLPLWIKPLIAVFVGLAVFSGAKVLHVNNAKLHERLAQEMPVQAVELVKKRGYSGPLYNDYEWGGFLLWHLRMPVSIDGRAALYGDQRINRSIATWRAEPDWASDPELASASLVIAPVKAPLTQILRLDSGFHLVYEDKVAAVFSHFQPATRLSDAAIRP